MNSLGTMTCWLTTEIMPLHATSKATAERSANNVHERHPLERRREQLLANLKRMIVGGKTELANPLLRFTASLRHGGTLSLTATTKLSNMPALSTRSLTARPVAKAQLDSTVAIAVGRSHLQHTIWTSLNYRNGNDDTILVIDLSHPDFSTQQTYRHLPHPLHLPSLPNTRTNNPTIRTARPTWLQIDPTDNKQNYQQSATSRTRPPPAK
jgi:hypothetical protein